VNSLRKKAIFFLIGLFLISHSVVLIGIFSSDYKENEKIELSYDAGDYIGFTNLTLDPYLTGENVTVAILDTGIYANHDTFTDGGLNLYEDRILAFYDEDVEGLSDPPYDIDWHGTWTASILGGNCSEYQGVAPDVNFVIMKVFDFVEGSLESSIPIMEQAIDWIIENKEVYDIKIASMSFGAKPESDNLAEIEDLNALARRLTDNDILVVSAAGNYGSANTPGTVTAPGSDRTVLCVGGVDYEGETYTPGGEGPTHEGIIKPDVCAPAVSVKGAKAGISDKYQYASGTSAATPFVAGLAALMLEKNDQLGYRALKNLISLTSYRTIDPLIIKDNTQGWGIIQAYAALKALDAPIEITENTNLHISLNSSYCVYCQPIKLGFHHYFFELESLGAAEAELYIFNSQPNEYGDPNLISTTINEISLFKTPKRLGIFPVNTEDYYLVVKLVHGSSEGDFLVKLVIELRLGIIIAFAGINILAMIYIGSQTFKYRMRDKI